MKIAAIQMVSGCTLQANLETAARLLAQAAAGGAELAVLPEYFCLMGRQDRDKLAVQEPWGDGPIQRFLATQAAALGLWLVGGTLPLQDPDDPHAEHVFNSSLVWAPDGRCVARYDKMHLFRFDNGRERYDESQVLRAGRQPLAFDLDSRDGRRWRVRLGICYDLRFPELFRPDAADPADLLLLPSAFTYPTGQAHWEVLLRARAIENLAYVAAAAQGGRHENGRHTWGHALLIDPWGEVLAQQAQGEGVVLADCPPQRLSDCRARLPALSDRVPPRLWV